jgi:hypothetical protein
MSEAGKAPEARRSGLPAWERLLPPAGRRLIVAPVRDVELYEALVADGCLPALGGAVVFDAWPAQRGYRLRAVELDGEHAMPYLVQATSLRVAAPSDGQLERLIGVPAHPAPGGELERQACACVGVSADAAYRALASGWQTVDALKRATKAAFGVCQGRRCIPWLTARAELADDDPLASVIPRPPLIPVPASILAAFAPRPTRGGEKAAPGG